MVGDQSLHMKSPRKSTVMLSHEVLIFVWSKQLAHDTPPHLPLINKKSDVGNTSVTRQLKTHAISMALTRAAAIASSTAGARRDQG